jgi:hypothetical protein
MSLALTLTMLIFSGVFFMNRSTHLSPSHTPRCHSEPSSPLPLSTSSRIEAPVSSARFDFPSNNFLQHVASTQQENHERRRSPSFVIPRHQLAGTDPRPASGVSRVTAEVGPVLSSVPLRKGQAYRTVDAEEAQAFEHLPAFISNLIGKAGKVGTFSKIAASGERRLPVPARLEQPSAEDLALPPP